MQRSCAQSDDPVSKTTQARYHFALSAIERLRIKYIYIIFIYSFSYCFRSGIRLRQLTDGRHLVQVIYGQNGDIQDCEYIPNGKTTRNFLKTLRKELKLALDEEMYKLTDKEKVSKEEEKFIRHFGNVTFRILKSSDEIPANVAGWLNYDKLKMECLQRHEELKYMVEHKNRVGESSLVR